MPHRDAQEMNNPEFEFESKVYLEEFLNQIEVVEVLIMKLANESKKTATLLQINRIVHSLKGSAGSYGFDLLSVACHKIEDKFLSIDVVEIDTLINDLLGLKDTIVKVCKAYAVQDTTALSQFKENFGIFVETNEAAALVMVDKKKMSLPEAVPLKTSRVLIVENSKSLTNTLMRALSEFDVDVSSVKDGYELLGRILKERFDILITSLHIPTIDANSVFKVLDIVPHQNAALKTIIVTSSNKQVLDIKNNNLVVLGKGVDLGIELKKVLKSWVPEKNKVSGKNFSGKCKIMVIDDSPDIHQLIKISLKKYNNFQLIHCQDPNKAEAQILSEKPDLILLDVQMPEISGDQLLINLKAKGVLNNTLVVFLTATDNPPELARLASLSPAAILRKPFSPKLLNDQIQEILEKINK